MRISDWSSDVCSSDLRGAGRPAHPRPVERLPQRPRSRLRRGRRDAARLPGRPGPSLDPRLQRPELSADRPTGVVSGRLALATPRLSFRHLLPGPIAPRSEEHPSELQSLMRISYAVFCLKKKKTKTNKHQYTVTIQPHSIQTIRSYHIRCNRE